MTHTLKSFFLVVVIFTTFISTQAQHLDSLKNWRIHKLTNNQAFNIPEDSLSKTQSRLLPPGFLKELKQLEILETDGPAVVQTLYLLSYEDSKGKLAKVISCGVGNFIYIYQLQKYWRIPQENRESWLEIISSEYKQIPDK